MKTHILCLGDSNTHGYCADPKDNADGGIRFNENERWTCLLQKALGEDYKLTTTVTDVQSVEDVKAYTAKMNTQLLANYEVSADDISAVSTCTVQVTDAKGTRLATCNLTVVQIGHTWYVDNTTADTSALYQIGK